MRLGHETADLDRRDQNDHQRVRMQGNHGAEDLAGHIKCQGGDQADTQQFQRRLGLILGDFDARHHLAAAGQRREALADAIQQAGDDDREDVAERQRRHEDGDVVARRLAEQLFIDLAHRHRAGTHAAAHDGQGDHHDRILRRKPERPTHDHGEQAGEDHSADQRQGKARAHLHQNMRIHAEDAAGDQRCDIEIEKAAAFHECRDVGRHIGRQPVQIHECGGREDRQNRAATEISAYDRQAVTDMAEQFAEQHDHNEGADHAVGQGVGRDGQDHDREEQPEDGQAEPEDPGLEQAVQKARRRLRRRGWCYIAHPGLLVYGWVRPALRWRR